MIRRTIEFGTPGTRLSVSRRQLVVERPDHPTQTLPIEDLGVVIIDDRRAVMTRSVFTALMDAEATVVVTGPDHLPKGVMLPFDGYHHLVERHQAQVAASQPTRKRIWQALVRSKVTRQAAVLAAMTGRDHGLSAMAARVRSGDPDNLEAQAAQRYWPALFGPSFRRDREAAGVNALLNYGYAILRAAIARALVASGLIPSLGVFHRHRANAFCLADDVLESYRPFVDWRVRQLSDGSTTPPTLDSRTTRAALLSLLNMGVTVEGRALPLMSSIGLATASVAESLTVGPVALRLPDGLPREPEAQDAGPSDEDAPVTEAP